MTADYHEQLQAAMRGECEPPESYCYEPMPNEGRECEPKPRVEVQKMMGLSYPAPPPGRCTVIADNARPGKWE